MVTGNLFYVVPYVCKVENLICNVHLSSIVCMGFFSVFPHIAVIENQEVADNDITLPLNQNSQVSFPPLLLGKRDLLSCGLTYQGGLLYCNIKRGKCFYYQFGSPDWTEPPELQPNFSAVGAGCVVFGGKIWVLGGAVTPGTLSTVNAISLEDGMKLFSFGHFLTSSHQLNLLTPLQVQCKSPPISFLVAFGRHQLICPSPASTWPLSPSRAPRSCSAEGN